MLKLEFEYTSWMNFMKDESTLNKEIEKEEKSKEINKELRHKKRMQKQKQIVDAHINQANIDQGVVILLSGNGKGKSSSAFGMLARSLGHGLKCAVVQFIKGQWECGENLFFAQQANVDFFLMKTGFTWDTQNFAADKEAAEQVWQQASPLLADPTYDLIIFDELTYMFKFNYLDEDVFMQKLQQRPISQSVVITGRGASKKLINAVDTYSEITLQKHAFQQGIMARKGIEW